MKYMQWLTPAMLLALSATVVTPVSARTAPTIRTDVLNNTVIRGDLVVPELSHCELNDVTVVAGHMSTKTATVECCCIADSRHVVSMTAHYR
jgi:hypothetical protein